MLIGLIGVAGIVGVVLAVVQGPPSQPRSAPIVTPALLPQVTPVPLQNGVGPVSAFGFSVADDPAIHRVVLFGSGSNDDETWLWDGSRWLPATPPASPQGRIQATMAYDPETRQVLLFGGALTAGQVVNDTWAWSGTTWHKLDNGTGGPPGEGALMAWDGATREMVLITPSGHTTGGETWIWSGTHWSPLTGGVPPPTPIAGEMGFDPASNTLVFVSALLPPMGAGVTTWRFDGAGWQELAATPPSATIGLALDPVSDRLLLCSDPTPVARAQLWRWSGTGWSGIPNSTLSVQQGMEVSDADRVRFLIVGFDAPATQQAPQAIRVWEWNGQSWDELDSG